MPGLKDDFEFRIYLGFALGELTQVRIYATAAAIGFIICFFTNHYTLVPFIVPLFVQVIARANVKYRQRHLAALVELPAQTDAPVFIMDSQGHILLSVGKTQEFFKHHNIRNTGDFLNPEALDALLRIADRAAESPAPSVEAFSRLSMQWYEIKAKRMGTGDRSGKILVWCQDISLRKSYDSRLQDLLRYSGSLAASLESLVASGNALGHLASFLLKDYGAVFITRADPDKNLKGHVFKTAQGDEIIRSESIVISYASPAPINVSRQRAQIISDERDSHASDQAFLAQNPLDPRVLEFIAEPIRNFITYNEADLSIIAFNFKSRITAYEKRFFEILVNNYRTMVMLVDLEQNRR